MQASYAIARIAGPVMAVVGIAVLINDRAYVQFGRQLLDSSPLVIMSGVLALTGGLAILNAHPRWTADWRSIVTGLGWLLSLVGVFRIFAPDLVHFVGAPANPIVTGTFAILFLATGGLLTFKGYVAEQAHLEAPKVQRRELNS